MATESLESRAQTAIEIAKRAGADDAWAGTSRARSVELSFRDGKIEKVQENTSQSLSISLYVDGRYSSHGTTDLRPERLAKFIADAVALTRALEPDPFRKIPDPALFAGRANVDLELRDTAVESLESSKMEGICAAMDAAAHGSGDVLSSTSGLSTSSWSSASASTNGFFGAQNGTQVWLSTEVTVKDEGDKRPEGFWFAGATHLGDLPDPETIAKIALQRALDRQKAGKGPTRKGRMIVEPSSAASIVSRLLGAATAGAVQQGRSFWANRLGQKTVSDVLTVTDEPLLRRGLSSRLWDGEGIAAKPLDIVRGGVFSNLYVDTYYGRKAGMTPTTGSPSNRVIAPGKRNLAAILADSGEAILVTGWLGGNSDPSTGDFSLGIRGNLVEGGKIGAPIGEMNVTGNLVELFSRLSEVGNDPWMYASLRAPTIVFDDVQFSGA